MGVCKIAVMYVGAMITAAAAAAAATTHVVQLDNKCMVCMICIHGIRAGDGHEGGLH